MHNVYTVHVVVGCTRLTYNEPLLIKKQAKAKAGRYNETHFFV